jgi:hypothetical protein
LNTNFWIPDDVPKVAIPNNLLDMLAANMPTTHEKIVATINVFHQHNMQRARQSAKAFKLRKKSLL